MAGCALVENRLSKILWPYTEQTAAIVRNSCHNKGTRQTPDLMLTGIKPNFSRMQKFGTVCYTNKQHKGKLDGFFFQDITKKWFIFYGLLP